MDNQPTYELIEKYLNRELSGEDLTEVENRLKTEESFAQEVKEINSVHQFIELEGDRQALNMIDQARNEYLTIRRVSRRRYFALGMAAALVLIFFFVFPWGNNASEPSSDLFAEHFSPYRAPSVNRSIGLIATWEIAQNAYIRGDYETVMKTLQSDDISNEDYLRHFYLGVSYLALDQPDNAEAIISLEKVLLTDNDYHQPALWYKGLTLVNMGKNRAARNHFQTYLEDGNTYQREAVLRILEAL